MTRDLPPTAVLGRIATAEQAFEGGVVVLDGERIAFMGTIQDAVAAGHQDAVNAGHSIPSDAIILPGLVDIHCHGGGGASFPDSPNVETARQAAKEHLAHGTTSLVASLVTADPETLLTRVATLADLVDSGDLVGIHCEGPFLSVARCGAQDPESIQKPDAELVRAIASAARGHFTTMTIAPEVDGMDEVIDVLCEVGAIPSIGHTDSMFPEAQAGLDRSFANLSAPQARSTRPTVTHLFNGMKTLHHRDPGPIAACLATAHKKEAVVELVADGTHLSNDTARFVFEMVGADSIMLVTDAMAAAGMPDGTYQLGPMRVRVEDGVARLADGDSIAGGTAHLLDIVRNCINARIPLADVIRAATITPATVLGMSDRIGDLRAGFQADLLVADAQYHPVSIMRRGAWVS